jgi:ATP-dependent helicase HepA
MTPVQPGQRWINHARPELGLGMVISTEGRTVTMRFGDDDRDHVFALESAPLSRIRFSVGDVVRLSDGDRVAVESVLERDAVLVYRGKNTDGDTRDFVETVIASNQSFNRPIERLLHGQIDEDRWFGLRLRTLSHRHRLYTQPLWGLLGSRTALLPHQLHVASEVARRHAPRVLLADEVGLGKTIEAGLIAHYQIVTERIRRVLIVVPESLLHQWLVEMSRRFNLVFSLFDTARCEAMEGGLSEVPVGDRASPAHNPFLEEQRVLVSREFLLDDARRRQQCIRAGWDLVIVDEAHHLVLDDRGPSPAYLMVESLAAVSAGLLLLTGTPRQLGASGHFARLRLLDPDRYHDPGQLELERRDFEPVADLVQALLEDRPLTADEMDRLDRRHVLDAGDHEPDERGWRDRCIDRLLDRFGTGRVMFRNTRASVSGFPRRRVFPYGLPCPLPNERSPHGALVDGLYPERRLIEQGASEFWAHEDPRLPWLEQWLSRHGQDKVLVICSSRATAAALTQWLKLEAGIPCVAFHEGLGLVERDRAAAWFADPVDGCQALVCSEIGSEGRNFQFARHLILFDLPLSPDLLEQRIGRLDRIGRDDDVLIHVPFLEGTPQQRLFDWYHQGLDAFESIGSVNEWVFEQFKERVVAALDDVNASLSSVIHDSREMAERLRHEMRTGRDRLLEYHSCRPGRAEGLLEEARRSDQDSSLRSWLEVACDCYDISLEPYRQNSVLLRPGNRMLTPVPGLPDEGLGATFDRNTALENEDLQFFSWEHPVVEAIADLVLNTERGNATICAIRHPALPRSRIAIECVFVIEAPHFARPELVCHVPPLLVSEIHDEQGNRLDPELDHSTVNEHWVPLKYKTSRQVIEIKRQSLRRILERAAADVSSRAGSLLHHHGASGLAAVREELDRLQHLRTINPNVRQEEIDHFSGLVDAVTRALGEPRVRLDAVRVLVGL